MELLVYDNASQSDWVMKTLLSQLDFGNFTNATLINQSIIINITPDGSIILGFIEKRLILPIQVQTSVTTS